MLNTPKKRRVAFWPGAGGTRRLTGAIGKFKAMKLLLTGLPITGEEASAMGLASEVVDDELVQERAMELARLIAALPPLAASQIKEVLLAGQDASLGAALLMESKAFHLLFAGTDLGLYRTDDAGAYATGQQVTADLFAPGDKVDVVGVSKGKGFSGFFKLRRVISKSAPSTAKFSLSMYNVPLYNASFISFF